MALLSKKVWCILSSPHCNIPTISNKRLTSVLIKRSQRVLLFCNGLKICQWEGGTRLLTSSKRVSAISFDEMIVKRRDEARRSIVIQVQSEQSASELHSFCGQFGSVKSMHHYSLPGPSHYILVEFDRGMDVDNVLHYSGHLDTSQIVPVRSPFLWFRIGRNKVENVQNLLFEMNVQKEANADLSRNELYIKICGAESVSDQILALYEATKLRDIGSRLRFLTAFQIEQALSGPFPCIRAHPFGSSVNGFGKMNCDLDLVLDTNREEAESDCRLIFHSKNLMANGRTQMQRHMEVIGDVCQLFLPGCANVRRILQARVPIVKYRQELTGVECDLTLSNMSGVYMSELLYLMGEIDDRVRPLVRAVRTWAQDVGLTNPSPGRWITNFSLTLMVLFYLQQTKPPVLPTLDKLTSMATPSDKRVTNEGVNCTFVRDANKVFSYMRKQQTNTDNLEDLLLKFFEFYCAFDFSSNALSLSSGGTVPKPEHCAIYISNPLERGLNVSKNVSHEEMERLRIEFRNAAWVLEANVKRPLDEKALWGLVAICQAPKLQSKGQNIFYIPPKVMNKHRTFDVSELFQDFDKEEKGKPQLSVSENVGAKLSKSRKQSHEIADKLSQKPTVRLRRKKR